MCVWVAVVIYLWSLLWLALSLSLSLFLSLVEIWPQRSLLGLSYKPAKNLLERVKSYIFFCAPMRIRKRQVPFPLSSLSPVPLSDPLLNRSPEVQLQLHNTTQPKASHPLENLSPQSDRYAHLVLSRLISPINVSHRSVEEATAWISLMMLLVGHTTRWRRKIVWLVENETTFYHQFLSFFLFFFLLLFVFIYICVFMTVHFGSMCPKDFMCMNFALC